jgi:diguanylate cyclase (GGDEF)-like protein
VIWRRRVVRRERQLSLVNELSAIVASPHLDRKQLLDSAAKLVRERTAAKAVAIQLIGNHGEVTHAQWDGMRDEDGHLLRNETVGAELDSRARTAGLAALEQRGYHLVARLPISGRTRPLGMLTVFSPKRLVSPETVATLATVAGIVGLGVENAAMARESEEREAELRQLAITDTLTGLYNRRFLEEYLRIQLAMAHRQREPVAFITVDVDGFKAVNDEFGHETGDRILARVGEILRGTARTSDLPVRLGGEEFLIAMPQTDADGARIVAERLLRTLAETEFTAVDRQASIRVTASAGVSAFPEHGDRVRTLLRRADEALSRAKSDGRNAVRVASG